jgi:hypothetical protein
MRQVSRSGLAGLCRIAACVAVGVWGLDPAWGWDYGTRTGSPAAEPGPAESLRPEVSPVAITAIEACGAIFARFGEAGDALATARGDDEAFRTPATGLAGGEGDLNRLLDHLGQANAGIDRVQAAYDRVTECRKASVRTIKAETAAGRLGRPAAERALALVRQLYENDLRLARLIVRILELQSERLRLAAAALAEPSPADPVSGRPRPPAARVLRQQLAAQTATNQAKRSAFAASVGQAESWKQSGFVFG